MVADPRAYMTYQPLLAEAAAGNLEPRHVVVPLRGVLRRTQVIKATVSSIDHPRRIAYLTTGDGDDRPLRYDILVLAPGSIIGGTPRPYRYASAGSVASLGLYRGVAEIYGLRMRGFSAWMIHRTYHLLKLPTMNRRLHVVADWMLALLFPREAVSLDVLEHPRQDFQAALDVIVTGPSRVTPFSGSGRERS
jgi:NADH dehydrogenase FAD-containing subunit